jgi:serine/threonine-protein kinase
VALLVTMIVARPAQPSDQSGLLQVTPMTVEQLNIGQPGIHFAVAPNGRSVIFSANNGSTRVLFRRDLDRIDPEPLAGTEAGSDVFFSEDGRRIGFEIRSELWTTSLDGGTPHLLVPNHPLRGGAWGEDGRLVVGLVGSGLWMTSSTVGEPRQLTVPGQEERHELPQILPGGGAVLFTILSISKPARAAVYIFDTGETRDLFEGTGARFVGPGHLVFGLQGKLWAVGFDPASLQTRGAARSVRDDVAWSVDDYPQFTTGGDVLAYVRTSQASANLGKRVLTWVDRQGERERLPLEPDNYHLPRLSPAGDRLLVQIGATRDVWIYDVGRGTLTPLTSDRVVAWSTPAWTPDGSRVLLTTWFDGEVGLGWVPADGSGPVQPLVKGLGMRSFESTHPVMLPDNSGVILTGLAPGASSEDLLIARLTGETRLETLLQARGHERYPAIAPNGRFLAYHSDESGRPEVYVRPFPGVDARRWQISTEGGAFPAWTRDGKEIVYQDGRGRIMAAEVRGEEIDEVDFSRSELLFTFGPGMGNGFIRAFDVTSDGERFLFLDGDVVPGSGSAVQLILIQNWTEELKRLVPREP